VALVVLAYALAPLAPLFRGILDGRFLWTWVNNELRRERVIDARRIKQEIEDARALGRALEWFARNQREWFDRVATTGNQIAPEQAEPERIDLARGEIVKLQAKIDGARLPTTEAESAFNALLGALETNRSSQTLTDLRGQFATLIATAADQAPYRWEVLVDRYGERFVLENPQATRMGDARLLSEAYSLGAYGANFRYLWPRLQLAFPDQGVFRDQLVAAQAQLDFAILSLILTLTLPVVWLPWFACMARTPWLFLAIGLGAPILATFFYRLAVESQLVLGDVAKTAIDRYRLDLLKILHQPLPLTLSAERVLWGRLYRGTRDGDPAVELSYRHPAS
jgi:hypothetical protein